MDGPWRLEVWRGERRVIAGSPPELLEAARRGAVREEDQIRVPENGATFRPRDVPFLAPHVRSRLERSTRRTLRLLLLADAILLPLGALFLVGVYSEYGMDGVRGALLPLFVFVVLFVGPIPALRARLRGLEALRARGMFPDERAGRPSTGDARLDTLLARRPIATHVAIGFIVAVSILAPPDTTLWWLFAKTGEGIARGEWWRLVTPVLVHGGALHLGVNMLAFLNIGPMVENLYGRVQLLAFILLGTVGATLGSLWFSGSPADRPSVGASGGLFALVGALIAFGVRNRHVLAPGVRNGLVKGMLWVVALNLAIGFSATIIDNAAHIGGLLTGLALGAVLPPYEPTRRILRARQGGVRDPDTRRPPAA